MYGETAVLVVDQHVAYGLSPRVRGNQHERAVLEPRYGSIPACTGKPAGCSCGKNNPRVYPRVYGETPMSLHSPKPLLGLSPRVRGNQAKDAVMRLAFGSIPACTGKPTARGSPNHGSRVYPRVYGETHVSPSLGNSITGLSPRVRGNPGCGRRAAFASGSIPACTGKPFRRGAGRQA